MSNKKNNKIQYIKEISISRFRSIGRMEIPVDNITIFSGKNNSGKSNILKALNLFFNRETSFHTNYDHDVDYNKYFRGRLGGVRRVKITVLFNRTGTAALKDDFWITREFGPGINEKPIYGSVNNDTNEKLKANDGNIIRQFTLFFNKINYVYIPAIRDRSFIKYLYQLFEDIIRSDAVNNKQLNESIGEISKILQSKSSDISTNFSKFIDLHTSASLSSNMKDILGAVTINVENPRVSEEYKKISSVDMFSSGDGILMSYIMYFIAYMSSKISNRYYIWGFEEPETALEYSKIQSLAEAFYNDFSTKAQIFITTHSPAFIKLKDKSSRVAFYRVYQNIGKDQRLLTYTQTLNEIKQSLFPEIENTETYKLLQEELHMVEQAQEIEAAVERLQEQERQHGLELEFAKEQLKNLCPPKIFICEDEKAVKLWESLLDDNEIKVMASCGCGKRDIESIVKYLVETDRTYSPNVFRTVDRDGYTNEQIKFIECQLSKEYDFNYFYKILPVYEIENFAVINHPKATEDLWFRKRDNMRDSFYRTAESNLTVLMKKCPDSELFGKSSKIMVTIENMFKEAEIEWRRFVNGKGMIDGLHYDDHLKNHAPPELTELINEIKVFLNQTKKGHKR